MEVLREEIRETEKTRNDLFKWKLGLVGALGAVGLGLAGSKASSPHLHADLVLAAIPPVSLYVDLLCRNLAVKMLVIGTFFRSLESQAQSGEDWKVLTAYEKHVERARNLSLNWSLKWLPTSGTNAFALEDEALGLSTFALSIGVGGYGLYVRHTGSGYWVVFVLSALVGLTGTVVGTWCQYWRRFAAVGKLAQADEAPASVATETHSPESRS